MLPTQAIPVLTPTPILTSPSPLARKPKASRAFSAAIALRIFSAARHARAAWPSTSTGAFQNAMMESPIYLSMVPSSCWISFDSGASSVLMKPTSSVAFSASEIGVKLLTSMNITVMSRASPPSRSASGDFSSCASSSGARYWLNAWRTNFFSRSVARCSTRSTAMKVAIAASDG